MIALAVLVLLHLSAGVQFRNHGIPDHEMAPPSPTDCDCRSRVWNDALAQATHFPDQEYPH